MINNNVVYNNKNIKEEKWRCTGSRVYATETKLVLFIVGHYKILILILKVSTKRI